MSTNDFLTLSEFLVGIPFSPPLPAITALDPTLAATYYARLVSSANDPPPSTPPMPSAAQQMTNLLTAWSAIAALPPDQWPGQFASTIQDNPALWATAQQIVLAWYTGVCGNVARTADLYDRTLVWVLAQAHPMGVPLAFGYWQYAPGANQ